MALTRKQRQLLSEIERIVSGIGVDHWNIEQAENPNERISFLLRAKDQLVRGKVATNYTLLDEILTDIHLQLLFPPTQNIARRSFEALENKAVQNFCAVSNGRVIHP